LDSPRRGRDLRSKQHLLRILTLVPYPLGIAPGQRYRTEQWSPYLREHGIELVFSPFADSALQALLYEPGLYLRKAAGMAARFARRFVDAWRAADYDAVLVQREACLVGPALIERLARARRPTLIYDFDDAVYLPYVSPTNHYLSYLKFPWKTGALCRMSDLILAGNDHLAAFARRHAPDSSAVEVMPSTISLRTYRAKPAGTQAGLPVLGWTGSHSSAQYLKLIEGPLRTLAQRTPFRLLLVGPAALSIPGVETETRPWRSESESEDLWPMDVGLMPLPDADWARGKCGMKALQYMAVGIPAAVSPVGVNKDIVTHGVNGLHARTDEEWVEGLYRLLSDAELRKRQGAAARRTVEEHYSAEAQVPRLVALLRRTIAEGSQAPADGPRQ
jgi:hypothetical protein